MKVAGTRKLWDMVDGPMPRGVLGLGSGDVHLAGDTWTLYLGGYSTSLRNRLYTATAPATGELADARWTVTLGPDGRARPLLADPPRRAWDGGGMHTPSYLPAADGAPARIYYAGRAGRRHVGTASGYAVGVLEERDGRWVRREAPIVVGDAGRPSALEPRVVRHGGRYCMWYLATPHEVAPGEQPDYELRTTVSDDGLTGWSEPEVFASSSEGFFDVALVDAGDRWWMVLARGTNLHGTTPFPAQGLWLTRAASPSPRRADWSPLARILDTDAPDTPAWMGRGVCDPALAVGPGGRLVAFVTGTRRYRSWLALCGERLARRELPPVPAPFYLSTLVLELAD